MKAFDIYHDAAEAKQAKWLSSPRPGRVDNNRGTYHIHLPASFGCDLNSFSPPLLLLPEPHVLCERMTPPLPLPSSYRPQSSSNELQTSTITLNWLDRISVCLLWSKNIRSTCKNTFSWGFFSVEEQKKSDLKCFSLASHIWLIKTEELHERGCYVKKSQEAQTPISDG